MKPFLKIDVERKVIAIKFIMNKSLSYFKKKYPNEEECYWAISDYLSKITETSDNSREILSWVNDYTIKKTGINPLQDALSMDISIKTNVSYLSRGYAIFIIY